MTDHQRRIAADALIKIREADEALQSIGCVALNQAISAIRVQLGAVLQYDVSRADSLLAKPVPSTDDLILRLRSSGMGLEIIAADRLEEMQERLAICAEGLR